MAYFGRFGQRTAIKHFKECVDESDKFSADLLSAGYIKWHSFFIPQQVLVIFNHMGPPDAITLIEWAEFSDLELPYDRIDIKIDYLEGTQRKFNFSGIGTENLAVIEGLKY